MITRRTIYFADDDYEDRLLLADAIRTIDPNIIIVEVENGAELLAIIRQDISPKASLIILDMNMPKLNGLETLAEIRAMEYLASTPAVLVSTSNSPQTTVSAKKLGVVDCFTKPYSMDGFAILARQLVAIIN